MAKPPPPPPPRTDGSGENRFPKTDPRWSRLLLWLAMFAVLAIFFVPSFAPSNTGDEISYDQFIQQVQAGEVCRAEINNLTGEIEGNFASAEGEACQTDLELIEANPAFTSKGPIELSETDRSILDNADGLFLSFTTPQSSFWANLIPLLLPIGLLIGFFWWMQRRAQGQIGGIMSIAARPRRTQPNVPARRSKTLLVTPASSKRSPKLSSSSRSPRSTPRSALASPRACCSSVLPVPVRR